MIVRESMPLTGAVADSDRLEYPCSQSQLRFWIEEQLSPQNPALNVAVRWQLDGTVEQPVLEEAWRRIVSRHDPLRTFFAAVDGNPVQIVVPQVELTIPVHDLRGLPEAARQAEAERLAQTEARTPFDIATCPLIRVKRIIVSDRSSILLVTAHHTVCDGWSIGILASEMGQLYAALEAGLAPFLPDLAIRYGEYAAWELAQVQAGGFERERAYVRELLRGFKQFELLSDHTRPRIRTSDGKITSVLLERALTDELIALARSSGCTLFMMSLAALFVLLHRYTGESDIVLGTQVAGREDEELEKLVGCFINTIALRGDLSGDPDFLTVLERTRDMVSDTFDTRELPLQQLIEIAAPLRDPSRNALFSVNFIFQRSFIANRTYGSFDLIDLPSRSAGALYDVNVFMVERPDGWRLSCEYNTALFDDDTLSGLLDRFRNLLKSIVENPVQRIAQLEILSDADRHALIVTANQTARTYPADKTLPQLIADQIARRPDEVAVTCGSSTLTYAQLGAAATRIAAAIAERGCAPGARIGILLDRSTDMLVAMLAVMEAGCAYVPLDPKYPAERLAFIAADAQLDATITRSTLGGAQFTSAGSILIDAELQRAGRGTPARLDRHVRADDVAYVIYTSGSTGKPKGVQISHRALVNHLWSMRERPGLSQTDTLVAVTTISFDIAGLELFLPLITGARVVIAAEAEIVDGSALLALLQRGGATVLQATPVTWQLLIEAGWSGDPELKMLCGGEMLPRPLADQLLDCGGELWNMYGPTETTIWSSAQRVERSADPVPIGSPIANTQFYVLDQNARLVPPGVRGELYIGGDGVALGYLGREELTKERFVPDPFRAQPGARMYRTGDLVRTRPGGSLEFFGRADHQIKQRGFRIELDEISAVLLRQPGVVEAVAIAVDDGTEPSIRAYVVGRPPTEINGVDWPPHLRSQIATFLPNYMLPAAIVVLAGLPRTPNGKIDRSALPRDVVAPTRVGDDATATPTEKALAEIAGSLLGRERPDPGEDLFAAGFHSLLVVRLVARITQTFGVRVPLRSVFEEPTVAAIARSVDAAIAAEAPPAATPAAPIVTYNADGAAPPLLFFHSDEAAEGMYCRKLSAAIGPAQPFVAISPHGTAGLPILTTIEAMAADFFGRIKAIHPHGPYRLGGFCAGGVIAFELARLLRANGDQVEKLLVINAYSPEKFSFPGSDALLRRIGLDPTLDPRMREKFCLNIARFAAAVDNGPAAILRYLVARTVTLFQLRRRRDEHAMKYPDIPERPRGTPETESMFAYLVAAFTYHPERYDGDMTLVWSAGEDAALGNPMKGDPTMGWAALSNHVRVIAMEGGHDSPIQERVAELGRHIAQDFAR